MIEITVKTLDSKNHIFSVPDDFTVKQFKERIAGDVNITAESQRLIYCGRVLQDDKNLSEYDVNGKVIHLVQRAPPVSNGNAPDRGGSNTRSTTNPSNVRRTPLRLFGPAGNTGNAMYLGAMAFPADIMEASGIPMQQPRQCLSQNRLNVVRNMLRRANVILSQLENPPQESTDTSPDNRNGSTENNGEEDTVAGVPPIAEVEIAPTSIVFDVPEIPVVFGGPSVEIQLQRRTDQNNTSPEGESQPSQASSEQQSQSSGEQQPPQTDGEGEGNSTSSRYPRTRVLADLLDQAAQINTRVQPFMSQYQQLMRDDPHFSDQVAVRTNQRLFTSVSEIMHNLAHAYHALSDIMCDFSQAPPRSLRCRPILIHHSAVVQTGIPIQVAASLGASSSSSQPHVSSSSESAQSSGNTAAENTTSPASSGPPSAAEDEPASTPTTQTPPEETPAQSSTTTGTGPTPAAADGAQDSASTQQPTQPSATSSPRVTRVGSIGVPGTGFEIFVDMAPGSITIDSVETAVVTNATPNTSDANSWQNPPEFVQNLISALAGQFMGATLQQYRFPDQQSAGANGQQAAGTSTTTASSSQQTASGQTAGGSGGAQNGNGQTAASTTQNAGGPTAPNTTQNSQARGNTATHPTTATQTRSTARPHVHLSPSIHGLRSNNFDPFLPCNSHHLRSSRTGRQRSNQAQANNGTNTAAETPRVVSMAAPSSISISLRADPVISIDSQSSRSRGNQQTSQLPLPPELQAIFATLNNTNVTAEQPGPQHQLSQIVQAMHGGSTMAQLLQNVPGYAYTPGESILTDIFMILVSIRPFYAPGESILTDIFMILAQSLSLMDMIQLGMGSSECLIRARPQLRELISQRLLNNQPLTISATTQIIDRLNSELRSYFSVFENVRMREEVDLPASISLYNHSMLPSILNTVMDEDLSTFHRILIRKCTQYVRQLCALLQYCCLDGVTGLETILRDLVTQMTTGVPGILQEWTMTHSIINFRLFVSTLNVPVDDVKRFLVYRMGNPPATSPQPATTPLLNPPAAEPMEVQEVPEVEIESTPSHIREPPIADVPPTQHINEAIGWQNALPSEWVPIISRDSQRQRRQNPQGPFSDAYLSGMPSKRRKLITSAKPQGNLSQVITESMTTALGAAGMSSGPEVDVIAQRAGQDNTLRSAYREQVRSTLCHNLNSNPDYLPEKYPNTAKYFKKH